MEEIKARSEQTILKKKAGEKNLAFVFEEICKEFSIGEGEGCVSVDDFLNIVEERTKRFYAFLSESES